MADCPVGPDVFTFEIDRAGGGIEMSPANRRVLPAGIRNAPHYAVVLDYEVEQHFRGLSPLSRDHRGKTAR